MTIIIDEEKAVSPVQAVMSEARKERADLEFLSACIVAMTQGEKKALVSELYDMAGMTGNPAAVVLTLPRAIENCLKAGLSPNETAEHGLDLLHFYATPANRHIYKRLTTEFNGISGPHAKELMMLQGRLSDPAHAEYSRQLGSVFNYIRDMDTAAKFKEIGVPLAVERPDDVSVELAHAILAYIEVKHP